MTPAEVELASDGTPAAVAWTTTGPGRTRRHRPPAGRRVVSVLDRWRYDGRWWEAKEMHRDYFFVELDGGVRAELFSEEGGWWVTRVSD